MVNLKTMTDDEALTWFEDCLTAALAVPQPSPQAMAESYLKDLREGWPSGFEIDCRSSPDEIALGILTVRVSGPAHFFGAPLRGRAALLFSVTEAIPADLDPRLVEAMPELHAYYVDNVTWGSLHIVLDDGNVDDADVDMCLTWAKERGDHAGANIARLLQAVTPDQRLMLHEWWYGRGRFKAQRGVAA